MSVLLIMVAAHKPVQTYIVLKDGSLVPVEMAIDYILIIKHVLVSTVAPI